jgi:hypothetical protein
MIVGFAVLFLCEYLLDSVIRNHLIVEIISAIVGGLASFTFSRLRQEDLESMPKSQQEEVIDKPNTQLKRLRFLRLWQRAKEPILGKKLSPIDMGAKKRHLSKFNTADRS